MQTQIATLSARLKACLDGEKNSKPCPTYSKQGIGEEEEIDGPKVKGGAIEDPKPEEELSERQQHIDKKFDSICKSISHLEKSLPDGATSKENLEALAMSLENLDGMRIDPVRWQVFRQVQEVPCFTYVSTNTQLKIINCIFGAARRLDAEGMAGLTEFLSMFTQILHMYVTKYGEEFEGQLVL